jgi:NarL family two-component system response regulator LiaR
MTIRVLIADDHDMLREGIGSFLQVSEGLELIGEAASGAEAIQLCEELEPDVILMDLVMPELDGVTAIRHIHKKWPKICIIALSSFAENKLVKDALDAGATGYLLKNISAEKLAESIRLAHAGISILSPEITSNLLSAPEQPRDFDLTAREQDVLSLVVEGFSNAEIAYNLKISKFTVKNHVSNLLAKLGVSSRTEAVKVAMQNNLI